MKTFLAEEVEEDEEVQAPTTPPTTDTTTTTATTTKTVPADSNGDLTAKLPEVPRGLEPAVEPAYKARPDYHERNLGLVFLFFDTFIFLSTFIRADMRSTLMIPSLPGCSRCGHRSR